MSTGEEGHYICYSHHLGALFDNKRNRRLKQGRRTAVWRWGICDVVRVENKPAFFRLIRDDELLHPFSLIDVSVQCVRSEQVQINLWPIKPANRAS